MAIVTCEWFWDSWDMLDEHHAEGTNISLEISPCCKAFYYEKLCIYSNHDRKAFLPNS